MPKIKSLLKNLSLLIASLLVGFLLVEGAARLLLQKPNTGIKKGIAIADERGFTVFQKNFDGFLYSSELKREVHVKTNAEGFIGRDYEVKKPEKVVRVALLGDSMVEATQADYETTFAYLLEQELNRQDRGATKYEFMNFGVGGQGTMEEIVRYQYYISKYRPDVVMLFFISNDFENNQYYLDKRDLILARDPNWMNIEQVDANFKQNRRDFKYLILKNFRSVQYLDKKVRQNAFLEKLAVRIGLHDAGVIGLPQEGIHPRFFVYQEPLPETHKIVYDFSYELLQFLEDLTAQNGSKLIVAYLPEAIQVDEQIWQVARQETPALQRYVWNFDQPNQFFAENLETAGIPFLDFNPVFRSHYLANPAAPLYNFRGKNADGHLNEAGHRLVSEIIIKFLQTYGFIKE